VFFIPTPVRQALRTYVVHNRNNIYQRLYQERGLECFLGRLIRIYLNGLMQYCLLLPFNAPSTFPAYLILNRSILYISLHNGFSMNMFYDAASCHMHSFTWPDMTETTHQTYHRLLPWNIRRDFENATISYKQLKTLAMVTMTHFYFGDNLLSLLVSITRNRKYLFCFKPKLNWTPIRQPFPRLLSVLHPNGSQVLYSTRKRFEPSMTKWKVCRYWVESIQGSIQCSNFYLHMKR